MRDQDRNVSAARAQAHAVADQLIAPRFDPYNPMRTMNDVDKRSRTATEKVEESVREAIYKGTLKPRERVIEEDVARRLKCSRGTVREAFLRLQRDGLVVTIARRGTFIRDISAESIEVVFDMRGKLESLCVRYLRQHLSPEMKTMLYEALKRLGVAATRKDEEAFFAADMNFHQTVWRFSNHQMLEQTLTRMMNPFIFMMARAYSAQTPLGVRYEQHAQYLDTILTETPSKAERYVERYFREKAEEILCQIPHVILTAGPQENLYASKPAEL